MYSHLNSRTRKVIENLIEDNIVELGNGTIGPLEDNQSTALKIISSHLNQLQELKGAELAENFVSQVIELEKLDKEDDVEIDSDESVLDDTQQVNTAGKQWRLGAIKSQSFRGLAPSDQCWEFDFDKNSHLFYGSNGCGKSSLLGAIAWCLTGRIFRDDCAPSIPETIKSFSMASNSVSAKNRPDGLTLTKTDGSETETDSNYWVDLQLITLDELSNDIYQWIRRHSSEGLRKSHDGIEWISIDSLDDANISEIDAEINILMPARVSHMRFGKDPDLARLFSQIVGFDDLADIAELAGRIQMGLNREANKWEKNDLVKENEAIEREVKLLEELESEALKKLPAYLSAMSLLRVLSDVESLQADILYALNSAKITLAEDLGIEVPESGTDEEVEFVENLNILPGQLAVCLEELGKPISEIFESSMGFDSKTEHDIDVLRKLLDEFIVNAEIQTKERIEWAIEETKNEALQLFLISSKYYSVEDKTCPVCTQSLEKVPFIQKQLNDLKASVEKKHLFKEIDDIERELIENLNEIVPVQERKEGKNRLKDRVLTDWNEFKQGMFSNLLETFANKFDSKVNDLVKNITPVAAKKQAKLSDDFKEYSGAFNKLDIAIQDANDYISLLEEVRGNSEDINNGIVKILTSKDNSDTNGKSLIETLEQGSSTNESLSIFITAQNYIEVLYRHQKSKSDIEEKIKFWRQCAISSEIIKSMGAMVRQEIINVVGDVEPAMKKYYGELYTDDILNLSDVTTGNAANPELKNELNVYFEIGNEKIPVSPFSNAGRLRALAISFVFSLLEKSTKTLDLVLFDDPALSLDDIHKTRLVRRLVAPLLNTHQVVLATHYEQFYKKSLDTFSGCTCLELIPRRTLNDVVSFEPSDILSRVEEALSNPNVYWRDIAGSLRRWVERSLHAISSYCPEVFFDNMNLQVSSQKYAEITDPRIATPKRDKIVEILTPDFIRNLHQMAHDDDVQEADVLDALQELKKCRKFVQTEIVRIKEIYLHTILGAPLAAQPILELLTFDDVIPDYEMPIVGSAAAASGGVGVQWIESVTCRLSGYPMVIVKCPTISPIAVVGQYLLLDPTEKSLSDSDLSVVRTDTGEKYLRRYWGDGNFIQLEATNITLPFKPVKLSFGSHLVQRVVGVIYGNITCAIGEEGDEWTNIGGSIPSVFDNLKMIRVVGHSMNPIALDGQFVLIEESLDIQSINDGELACVDIVDKEAVIKRCYPADDMWVLISINPNDVEEPIKIRPDEIRSIYKLAGVLFEVPTEQIN